MNLTPALPLKSSAIIMDGASWVGNVSGYLARPCELGITGDFKIFDGITFVMTGDLGADIPFINPGTPVYIIDDLYRIQAPELYMHVRLVASDQYVGIQTYDADNNIIEQHNNAPGTYDMCLTGVARIHYYVSHGATGGGIDPIWVKKLDLTV